MKKWIKYLYYGSDYFMRKYSSFYKYQKKYCQQAYLENEKACKMLIEILKTDTPFVLARYGFFELSAMRAFEFGKKKKYDIVLDNIYNCAGFFPKEIKKGQEFHNLMLDATKNLDILVASNQPYENYFISEYVPRNAVVIENFAILEPWSLENPWTEALEGKKVLVVSPFSKSVEEQYQKREFLFQGTNLLPQFDLQTYQSLMTVGDLRDERFGDWFEALEFMKEEILSKDFDVAILGCGAYGFPLAVEIKKAGKQAIHMGGVFQILFGIMGKRWDGSRFGGIEKMPPSIKKYYNEHWTYPLEEKPAEACKVEYGPYWG